MNKLGCVEIRNEAPLILFFKIIYLVLVLLSFNSVTAHTVALFYFSMGVSALGAAAIFYKIIYFRKYINSYSLIFLVFFEISYCISMFITRNYGISENFKALVWMTFQFFILYAFDHTKSSQRMKKEFQIISMIFINYMFIANIVGLIFMILSIGYPAHLSPTGNLLGFIWGRLWGIYTDPNYASVLCCISILLDIYFYTESKRRTMKLFYILQIIINILYISFSDSRTGLVCLFTGTILYTFYLICVYHKFRYRRLAKNIVACLIAVLIGFSSLLMTYMIKNTYNYIQTLTLQQSINHPEPEPSKIVVPESGQNDKEIVGREQDIQNDISNRRFSIWKSGIEIWNISPAFGVSFRNIVSFAKSNLPKTYITNNDMGDFPSFHNMFIDVLVSQGLFGIFSILCFIIAIFILIIKSRSLFKPLTEKSHLLILLLIMIVVIAVSSQFLSDIIYINSAGSFLFWHFLSYLVYLLSAGKRDGVAKS